MVRTLLGENIMKKSNLTLFLLLISTVLLTVQCSLDSMHPDTGIDVSRDFIQESSAIFDNNFAPDRVVIVLSKSAGFREYTQEDFPETKVIEVIDSTYRTMRQCL